MYDPSYSEKGVLLAATRVRRNPNPFDFELPMIVKEYDPNQRKRRRDQQVRSLGGDGDFVLGDAYKMCLLCPHMYFVVTYWTG